MSRSKSLIDLKAFRAARRPKLGRETISHRHFALMRLAKQKARQENRSFSGYIVNLIERDLARSPVKPRRSRQRRPVRRPPPQQEKDQVSGRKNGCVKPIAHPAHLKIQLPVTDDGMSPPSFLRHHHPPKTNARQNKKME